MNIKWRGYYKALPPSTEPLIGGCNANKRNFKILDYCDKHDLNRTKATIIDGNGDLHLKSDCHNFKLTQAEKGKGALFFKMFTDKNIYDNPVKLEEIKRQIKKLG